MLIDLDWFCSLYRVGQTFLNVYILTNVLGVLKYVIMSLQDLCIDVIVKNFERFFLAFCTTKDVYLKMHFEFLQKWYSHQIMSLLDASDKMQPKYIDLVINKYLTVLDTRWFEGVPWETVVEKFAEIGPSIQKISFKQCWTETTWQNIIQHLINAESMEFESNCSDEILEYISQFCHDIAEIDVTDSISVTNEGIKNLCMKKNGKPVCPKLKKFSCADSDVSEDGIEYLVKNLRSLEEIDYRDLPEVLYTLHKNDLLALDKVEPYNITRLDLLHVKYVSHYDGLLKICLTLCPHVKSLYCAIGNEEQLNFISGPSELEVLHLQGQRISGLDITNFLKINGRKLVSLSIWDCIVSLSTLPESCPYLKELVLIQIILKNDSDIISRFRHLEVCTFENVRIDHQCCSAESASLVLKHSPNLDEIIFKTYDLSSTALKTAILNCCENSPITRVMFMSSLIDLKFAKDILMNCHTLQVFKIVDCSLERDEELELYRIAQILPNCPFIDLEDYMSDDSMSDMYEYMNALGFHIDDINYDSDYEEDDDYDYDDDHYNDI